ncbi:MAG: hypothetical protein EOO77_36635 [Oxalobacteraceae bacterium]|nr:MAG: hypothetical protein EOO77_36635 [Oxalobacteraceae bacterium]
MKNYDVFEIPAARLLEFCADTHRSIPSFSPDFLDWIDQRGYRGAIHMDTDRQIVITDANAALEFKLRFY